jgi:hypothetical protein
MYIRGFDRIGGAASRMAPNVTRVIAQVLSP